MDGLSRASSLGLIHRSAESLGLNAEQTEWFNAASDVWANAGMIEGVGSGTSPRLSLVVETQVAKTTASLELKTAAIVYSTANSGQSNGQSQNGSGNTNSAGINKPAKTSGWVKPSVFNSLDAALQKKVAAAIEKGLVAPTGQQGIIKLTATEVKETGYQYKVKILGKGGDIRIYGNPLPNGHIYFDKIGGH